MHDTRIDTYIARSQPFAQPILEHLRELIHQVCPDVQETIKWGFPHFEYNGAILCNMASFKQHCSFGFWKASLMNDPHGLLETVGKTAMGHFGRINNIEQLPADKIIKAYIKEAVRLNKEAIKLPPRPKVPVSPTIDAPEDFMAAIRKNKAALKTFNAFSPTNKKEYIEWITGARTDATRLKRMEQAVEWISEGKIRHWKYAK